MINVGVYGATGYAGYELLRWLGRHRGVRVVFTTSESQAGRSLAQVFPGPLDGALLAPDEAALDGVDVVFLALPHGVSASKVQGIRAAGPRVIDLSADLRLRDADVYAAWYGHAHPVPELLPVPYGLPELYRAGLRGASLVANPGCYPTSVLLGLAPLLRAGVLAGQSVVVDAKSGVSGAGRVPKQQTHFVEVHDSLAPYSIGRVHRHVGEMQQEAGRLSPAGAPEIIFSPHLLPLSRGLLSTMYAQVPLDWGEADVFGLYAEAYAEEPFVRVLPPGTLATIAHTAHTNVCAISLTLVRPGFLIVVASIDNLVKGAAGQAIQNLNLMFDFDEREGLQGV